MRAASLLLVLLFPLTAAAEVEDYLIIFTADSKPYNPTRAHTFAAVVRVDTTPGQPARVVDFASMSWLPETMKVRAWKVWPEKGRNVPLDETLTHYFGTGSRVCMWGPYRIQSDLADMFMARVATVEGTFQYQGACFMSPLRVCDCARSVEEMIGTRRRYIGVFGYGAAAGSVIVRNFSPWMIHPEQTHPWVATLIGLDQYPLTGRSFGDYSSRWNQFGAAFWDR
jgi:hypothetical protein